MNGFKAPLVCRNFRSASFWHCQPRKGDPLEGTPKSWTAAVAVQGVRNFFYKAAANQLYEFVTDLALFACQTSNLCALKNHVRLSLQNAPLSTNLPRYAACCSPSLCLRQCTAGTTAQANNPGKFEQICHTCPAFCLTTHKLSGEEDSVEQTDFCHRGRSRISLAPGSTDRKSLHACSAGPWLESACPTAA